MCVRVLAELEQLQDEVRSSTFEGDPASLRSVAECPFPRAFLDMLQTIDAFEGKPLLEVVAAGVAIEHRITVGRQKSADSNGLGQGHVAFMADKREHEVERFKLRIERQHTEQKQLRKSEQAAAARHVSNLDAAEKSLREMRAEEGRIRMELAKVHAKAAHQRALLEKIVQGNGESPWNPSPLRVCSQTNNQVSAFGYDCRKEQRGKQQYDRQGLQLECSAQRRLERAGGELGHGRAASCTRWR